MDFPKFSGVTSPNIPQNKKTLFPESIMFKIYSDQQYEYRQQIEDCEKEKQKILQENIALEKRINSRTNLLQIDAAIRKERDLQTLKCLFAKIIDNVN